MGIFGFLKRKNSKESVNILKKISEKEKRKNVKGKRRAYSIGTIEHEKKGFRTTEHGVNTDGTEYISTRITKEVPNPTYALNMKGLDFGKLGKH